MNKSKNHFKTKNNNLEMQTAECSHASYSQDTNSDVQIRPPSFKVLIGNKTSVDQNRTNRNCCRQLHLDNCISMRYL